MFQVAKKKRNEAYFYVLHVRDDIGFTFDQKIERILRCIKEIEDGIKILQTSSSITLLITDFEKTLDHQIFGNLYQLFKSIAVQNRRFQSHAL